MPVAANYTNQTAILERYAGKDGFGKPTYDPPQTIRVRKVPARGVVRSATGTDVVVETEYRTEAEVKLQDRLDGLPVRRVSETVLKDGTRFWYKVAV